MIDGQPEPGSGRVRFAGTADIDRLLADAPGVRTALLDEGVPATAFRVAADAQLAVLTATAFLTSGSRPPETATRLPWSFHRAASWKW